MLNSKTSRINGAGPKTSPFHRINPVLKFISVIFLIVFIFSGTGFLLNIILLISIIILWTLSKPSWKSTKIIIYSASFVFLLIFIINWIVVKTPTMAIYNKDTLNIWGKFFLPNQHNFNNTEYSYTLADEWGIKYYEWPIKTDQYFISDNYKIADSHFTDLMKDTGYKWQIMSVVSNGDRIWMCLAYKTQWYTLSSQTFIYAWMITMKITLMVMIVTLLVSATTNVELSYAIYVIILPLKIFKAPVKEWAMILSLAFRFVPTLVDESKRILNAQASRGVDFSNGNYIDKIKSMSSLLIPIFSIGFIKSNDLANAMEARSYFPEIVATKYRQYKLTKFDWIYLILFGIVCGITIMIMVMKIVFGPLSIIDILLSQVKANGT
ncbi:MAG: hypothetical protein Ta2E_04760 [Mycoplasmoidaceae bacterium]|nr:MAG: hypothetical protein Ta2E_04760 [Mycoplasmoidaceae bacterium]